MQISSAAARTRTKDNEPGRGRLKIFVGYAPGVGKTLAMLQSARRKQSSGIDVVIACLQADILAQASGLFDDEAFVFSCSDEAGQPDKCLDLDAILTRRPQIALVDDLVGNNLEPSQHHRRFQDVEELLGAGIDVYATLNIQHLESLRDVVEHITGTDIQETVPDRILDEADEIQLIDLPPEDLLERIRRGEYSPFGLSPDEVKRFYRPGNLHALRELALRRAAGRVDDQMRTYMQQQSIAGPWPATERLLVCVGPGPGSQHLVRAALRLASDLDAEWFTVHVETPEQANLSISTREQIWRTLHYAEALGAHVTNLTGRSVAERLVDYARKNNITKIIIGKPMKAPWRRLLRRSIVDQVIRLSRHIDVYVIVSNEKVATEPEARQLQPQLSWIRYVHGIGLVVAATLLGFPIDSVISTTNLVMLYLVAVVIAATQLGLGPAVLTAFLSVLSFDYFLVPPRFTLVVADTEYLLTFAGLLIVGVVISTLVSRVGEQTKTAQQREEQTSTLYALSRELAVAGDVDAIVQVIVRQINHIFGQQAAILLPVDGTLKPYMAGEDVVLGSVEMRAARWAFEHAKPAGKGTDIVPDASMHFFALTTPNAVMGILGVRSEEFVPYLGPEQDHLLQAFASQTGLAIERALFAEQVKQSEVLTATAAFQTTLLNSISHDLRTPLVSITGVLTSLRDEGADFCQAVRDELIDTAYGEARRLNRFVGNLLDITRIEGGALRINRDLCDVEDLIGSALASLNSKVADRPVTVEQPANLPLVWIDFVLMNQVLVNLLDNAIKYSDPGSPIDVRVVLEDDHLIVKVLDRGTGIPSQDLDHVFEKFYRVPTDKRSHGTGLGLSISKGIVEAHGGRIWAENRDGGGTIIAVSLPATAA